MDQRANRAKALREEVEGIALEFRLVSDATMVELNEAHDDAEGVSLAKQDLERALAKATTKGVDMHLQKFSVETSLEEASKLSSKINVMRVERDETVDKVATAGEEVLRFSTKLIALRFDIEALHTHSVDLDTGEESSRIGLEAVKGEVSALHDQIIVLTSRELNGRENK
ncbi:hypothetical protein ACLOJK_001332 [Asimina triloba]